MVIEKTNKKDLFGLIEINTTDKVLYLGGRIDDDNLYPDEYIKYFKQ